MGITWITVPDSYAQPRRSVSNFGTIWLVAKQNASALWRVGIGAFLLTTVRMARFTLLPLFAADVLNLSASQIGIILSAASIADMLNVYTAGILMDRFGRRWAAIPCVGVMAISMLLMPLTTGFWGLLLVGLIAGAGNGFGSGIMMTMGSDLSPANNREEFLSLWILILDLGGVVCPLIVGAISEAFSLTVSGFAFFGIGIAGVLAFLFLVPETKKQKHSKQPIRDAA
jgi:MFS family permease